MAIRSYRYFVGDFETTTYKGQTSTEVWASALVELGKDDVAIFNGIHETFDYLVSLKTNIICYYHNLKFDGNFWLYFLMHDLQYEQAFEQTEKGDTVFIEPYKMKSRTFQYSISARGMWYSIDIKVGKFIIELRDSLKLLPFSVKAIGKGFNTKHRKLDMQYEGYRYSGCPITEQEREYIANDVLVVKEALEIMFEEGHTKLTIGSCCLAEFKSGYDKQDYDALFPDMYNHKLDEGSHTYSNAGDWIRKSYHGGWCYLVKGKENKVYHNGVTADVNSLYPSMMHSESGNKFPTGEPVFFQGKIPDWVERSPQFYWFVRIKTRFRIKEGMLPTVQIKGNLLYDSTEWLTTSDIYDEKTCKYYDHYVNLDGELVPAAVELTLTMTDYQLLKEHYDLIDTEYIDGCYFRAECGIFDRYIDKYRGIKMNSKGAKRTLAKLFLNNLYGKMASNKDSSFKVAYLKEDDSIGFYEVLEQNKTAGYIPVGTAITSYARNFTIRAAQKNYRGVNERGFIYADTDSIHCDLQPDEVQGITVHPHNFCSWKLEACWDTAIFTRQKTYIEHVTHEDLEPLETPYYNIKCAGMPDRAKELFINSIEQTRTREKYTEEEEEFITTTRTLEDFKVGLKVPTGRLRPNRIKGGVVLIDGAYEMR